MDGGEDHHRVVVVDAVLGAGELARVDVGDLLVHVEEVAVALAHHVEAEAVDGLGEVEEYGQAGVVDAEAVVAAFLGGAGCDVARHEVTEGGVAALEVVVALFLGDVGALDLTALELAGVLDVLGHPDAAVVAERLGHEGELGLLVAVHGDAGGVDLHVGGVGEVGALAVAGHGGADVAGHGVGGQEVGVAVAAGGDDDGVGGEALHLARHQVLGDDAAGALYAVGILDQHHVVHLVAVEALDLAGLDLAVEGRVCAEQELLACLALGVECAGYLCAAEGAVGEQAAVFASEGHALCHTLVDDVVADLGQAVYVGLAGAVVAALDGVVEEAVYGVAVVLVVLGGVDAALCGDGVCAAGGVLDAEVEDVEAHLREGGGCGGHAPGQCRPL